MKQLEKRKCPYTIQNDQWTLKTYHDQPYRFDYTLVFRHCKTNIEIIIIKHEFHEPGAQRNWETGHVPRSYCIAR